MTKPILVAPSLLAADPMSYEKEAKSVEDAGADLHHVDVMDGHFVPNLTFGLPFIRALKKTSKIPLDVHIMISNPDQMAIEYVHAGADTLVFHVEAAVHPHRLIQMIKDSGKRAGIAINPGTSISTISSLIPFIDVVNVMTVNPGFGGQNFIQEVLIKIEELRNLSERRTTPFDIQVDGGINLETVAAAKNAGANILVAGTAVFGHADRKSAIELLKGKQ